MKKLHWISRLLVAVALTLGLAACGGGGDDGPSYDATATKLGGTVDVNAGNGVRAMVVEVSCPHSADNTCNRRVEVTGLRPTPTTMSTVYAGSIFVGEQYYGMFYRTGNGWEFYPEPDHKLVLKHGMKIEIDAYVDFSAQGGTQGVFDFELITTGGTFSLAGSSTTMRVVAGAARVDNVSSGSFNLAGKGEMGGFDYTCPSPNGCELLELRQSVRGDATQVGKTVGILVGSTYWYETQVTVAMLSGDAAIIASSLVEKPTAGTLTIPAGTTVRFSISGMTAGTTSTYSLVFRDPKTGMYLNHTGQTCIGMMQIGCKG